MYEKAKSGRDAFTFSLNGLTTIASFTHVPAIADNRHVDLQADRPVTMVREIEDFLARYFAPGCCLATSSRT